MSETRTDDTSTGGNDHGGVETDADVENEETTEAEETTGEREDGHLDAVDADCGCAEVWETLSEQREE